MTTETAIVQLKNRAEIAQQKGWSDAGELTQICNAIIDYYNRTEDLEQQNKNLVGLLQVFSEMLSIRSQDLELLKQAPARFVRKRLLFRSTYAGMDNMWLFHIIATDWEVLQECISNKQHCQQMADMLNSLADQQSDDLLYGSSGDASIINLQNDFVRLAADFENEIISLQ